MTKACKFCGYEEQTRICTITTNRISKDEDAAANDSVKLSAQPTVIYLETACLILFCRYIKYLNK